MVKLKAHISNVVPVTDSIFWIGANDHETDLFEAIWPLPFGISYNSYIVMDEKVALIDTVNKNFIPDHIKKIKKILTGGKKIDYLVINHMEPDHSGAVKTLLELFPDMQIVGNAKTADLLKHFYNIEENVKLIKDGDVLDLGKHKLKFFITPMVHWPETMMTYETTSKILFSGDVFGGFGALPGGIFDDEVDMPSVEEETRRYFSNIIGKFSSMVQKALVKLENLDINIIASTHGPVFRTDPGRIVKLYDKWSRHQTETGAVIVYGSMYGNTEKMADAIGRSLAKEKIHNIKLFNISRTHISFIINEIWRYKALILGSSTYNTKLFPLMDSFLNVLEPYRLQNHVLGIFGSYGWSGGALDGLKEFAKKTGLELAEPHVEVKCAPTEENLKECEELGKNIARLLT